MHTMEYECKCINYIIITFNKYIHVDRQIFVYIKNISLLNFRHVFRRPSLPTKIIHGRKLNTGENLKLYTRQRAQARSDGTTRRANNVMEDEYGRDLCVRGYHVYEAIWRAATKRTR